MIEINLLPEEYRPKPSVMDVVRKNYQTPLALVIAGAMVAGAIAWGPTTPWAQEKVQQHAHQAALNAAKHHAPERVPEVQAAMDSHDAARSSYGQSLGPLVARGKVIGSHTYEDTLTFVLEGDKTFQITADEVQGPAGFGGLAARLEAAETARQKVTATGTLMTDGSYDLTKIEFSGSTVYESK